MDFGWPNIEIDQKRPMNGRLLFLALTGLKYYVFLLFRECRSLTKDPEKHAALRGMGFMGLFVYKYIADTSFVMISCVDAGGFVS